MVLEQVILLVGVCSLGNKLLEHLLDLREERASAALVLRLALPALGLVLGHLSLLPQVHDILGGLGALFNVVPEALSSQLL